MWFAAKGEASSGWDTWSPMTVFSSPALCSSCSLWSLPQDLLLGHSMECCPNGQTADVNSSKIFRLKACPFQSGSWWWAWSAACSTCSGTSPSTTSSPMANRQTFGARSNWCPTTSSISHSDLLHSSPSSSTGRQVQTSRHIIRQPEPIRPSSRSQTFPLYQDPIYKLAHLKGMLLGATTISAD